MAVGIVGGSSEAQLNRAQNFHDALAEDLRVAKTAPLEDSLCFPCSPSFSPDGKQLLFVLSSTDRSIPNPTSTIRIVNVPSGTVRRSIEIKGKALQAVWSPDASRLLIIMQYERAGIIYDLGTQRAIPIGELPTSLSGQEGFWAGPSTIYFFLNGAYRELSSRFDLENLKATRFNLNHVALSLLRDSVRYGGTRKPKTQVLMTNGYLSVANSDSSFERNLKSVRGTELTGTSDGASLAVRNTRGRRSSLHLVIMELQPRIPTSITATLIQSEPLQADAADLDAMRARLAEGKLVYALVKKGRLNPLNNRLVGVEGDATAVVRILSVNEGTLLARIVLLDGTVLPGAVLSEFWEHTSDYAPGLHGAPGGVKRYKVHALVSSSTVERSD